MHRVTTTSSDEASNSSHSSPTIGHEMNEMALKQGVFTTTTMGKGHKTTSSDPEKARTSPTSHQRRPSDESLATTYSASGSSTADDHRDVLKCGRPETATLIREAVRSTPTHQRVLVAACGPDGLMRVVRDTTASLISGDGPGVELHCEQFGW